MSRFPFVAVASPLAKEDLHRLAIPFARSVRHFFPGTDTAFVSIDEIDGQRAVDQAWHDGLRGVCDRGRPALSPDGDILFMPVWNEDDLIGVAVMHNGDLPFKDMSGSWLLEVSRILSREFRLVKQWSVDGATGLPNGQQLRDGLVADLIHAGEGGGVAEQGFLLLVEIHVKGKDGEQVLAQISRAAGVLDGLIGSVAPLYACGAGVFGTIWRGVDAEQVLKMAAVLLRRMKRENYRKVHLGIAGITLLSDDAEGRASLLLDQAWEALCAARRRGPHALCTYESLSRKFDHPFEKPPVEVMRQLGKLWRGLERFALILLRPDDVEACGEGFLGEEMASLSPGVASVSAGRGGVYVLMPDADGRGASDWVDAMQHKLADASTGAGCSAGIALFPCGGYRKSEMATNAAKALWHASFFGVNGKAVFDAVTLNISGDVYYNDGDLARSVKEYRQGLRLDPESVNLLNSLGVVLVQMNRHRVAIPLFEKAAALDGADFMAPFNLGFAYLDEGRVEAAVAAFEKALAIDSTHADLLFWLGRLYCQLERYREAAPLLERAMANQEPTAPLLFALATACQGVGKNREAIVLLEKAARLNPRDAGVLSLLGELYCDEGQGNDVALSLCRQAVELDDNAWQSWYRLGRVQYLAGDKESARESLQQAMRFDGKNIAPLLLLAEVCVDSGQNRQGKRLLERVLRLRPDHGKAASLLSNLTGAG